MVVRVPIAFGVRTAHLPGRTQFVHDNAKFTLIGDIMGTCDVASTRSRMIAGPTVRADGVIARPTKEGIE